MLYDGSAGIHGLAAGKVQTGAGMLSFQGRQACGVAQREPAGRLMRIHTCQQVFLGDQSVGKTSIITRFMYDKFDNTYQVLQLFHRPHPQTPPRASGSALTSASSCLKCWGACLQARCRDQLTFCGC